MILKFITRLCVLTLSLPQAIIIDFANSIDPDETAQWAVSSGSTLFDIQSFNFTYKRLSKRWFVEIKKHTTKVVWNLAPKELRCFDTLGTLSAIFTMEITFMTSCLLTCTSIPFYKRDLFYKERIRSPYSSSPLGIAPFSEGRQNNLTELLPLKEYISSLILGCMFVWHYLPF